MISVVMGINKFDDFVLLAIDSILGQTLTDFEFIIVMNGSARDDIENRLRQLYPLESRFRLFKCEIPQLAHALNVGIDNAAYDYIARMDADDIAWPTRLERQFEYLKNNNLDLVGCDLRLIDDVGSQIGSRVYPKGRKINRYLSFRNCFAHNTVLMRKSVFLLARGYNAGFNSEDYDLWLRFRRLGAKWDNMSETLLDYRIHHEASQRRLLGYAEATGLAVREFILRRTFGNFFAMGYHFLKSILRSRAD